MLKFFKKIYEQIMQFDSYTKKYKKETSNIELPVLAYTNWGMHLADLKDFDNAIAKLETAILMSGQNPKPCISLGLIYAKLKEYDKASKVLNEAIKRDSQNAYAYSALSSVYVATDRFEEAETILKQALKISPSDAEIYLNYGILYAKTQKKLKAIEMFKQSKVFDPVNLHTLFLLGVMYFETDKIADAFYEFNQIEKINPKYKKLNYYLALCYQKENNLPAVIEYALRALEEEPDNPAVYVLLAHTYVSLNDKDKVIEIYKLGEERGIDDFEFLLSEGIVYSKYSDIEKSKQCILRALSIRPADSNALYRLGVCYKKDNNIDEAKNYFYQALASDENNSYALADIGHIKYLECDYNGAIQSFLSSINITSEKNYLYFYIANCYYKLGKLKKSLDYYEKTLEYYPQHIEALLNCSVCLLDMNNSKEALRKIRSAYQINRNSEKVILMYALSDLKCGIYSDAIEKTDLLLNKNPKHNGAKLVKAHTLINLKKPQIALNILETIDETLKNSEIFTFLSFLAYKTLVEENPSHYNESMLNLYLEKMNTINTKSLNESEIISYITKQ